jgi:hypothetical protein
MFKIQTDRQSWLTVKLPDPDGEQRIKLKVKLLSHRDNAQRKHEALAEHIARLQEEAASGAIEGADAMLGRFVAVAESITPEAIARDLDAIVARVTDWGDIGDADGNPLPYSPAALRQLLDLGTWIVKAVRDALTALDDNGRQKN